MNMSFKVVACIIFAIALLAVSCESPEPTVAENESAGPGNELVGVWDITGDKIVYSPDMNRETEVNDTHLPGIMVFTDKYLSWVDFHGESLPALPEESTDAQVAAVFSQLTAIAGTYEVEGSSVTVQVIVSKDPNMMNSGEAFNFEYTLEGDILSISWEEDAGYSVTLSLKKLE